MVVPKPPDISDEDLVAATEPVTRRASGRLPAASRRRQLLAVAKEVLAERGFHQTTMADIAKRAGVTKPVLYQHFESKRDLYTAVLHDTGNRLQEVIDVADGQAETPRQRVEYGFRAYVRFVQDDPDGFRLLFSSATRQDKEWGPIGARFQTAIADGIAGRIQVEGMSDAHRRVLAHGIMGLAEGMMRYWHSGEAEGLDFDDLLDDLQTLAWGGLRGLGG